MMSESSKRGPDSDSGQRDDASRCATESAVEILGADLNLNLEQEYEKFFQAVEASPSCVVITNRDGVIEYVNERFVISTGYSRDQAIGRKPNLLKSGQTPPEVYNELWATITAGKIWRGEMCNRKRSGEHYWEATAIAPIFGNDGTVTHFVAVKEDITERRYAKIELQRRQVHDAIIADVTHTLLADATPDAVNQALEILRKGLDVDRTFLFRNSTDDLFITNTHEALRDGTPSRRSHFVDVPYERYSWCLDQYRAGDTVAVNDSVELPNEAGMFKTVLLSAGIQANLSAPIRQAERYSGFIGADCETSPRVWSADDINLLERVAEVIGLALMRIDAEDELRQTHDRAHRAEQNLINAIDSMPEGFVLYDQDGKLVICNSRFREDYGYTEEQAKPGVHFMDLGLLDVIHGNVTVPDGYKDADAYLQTKLKYRIKLEGTFPVLLKDGRHLITRDRRTAQGGLVSVQTDITKIKETEEALRTSERKFWSVFHASPSLMSITLEKDGRYLDVNAKWVEVMGYDYTEAIGKTAGELNVWPSSLAREGMLREFSDDGILTDFEIKLRNRNGDLRDFLVSGVRMSVDGEKALLLVSHDITERKLMEVALKRSEQEIRTILDNIVEAFYRADSDGNMVMCSAAIEDLLGYASDEVLNKPIRNLYANPSDREMFLVALEQGGGQVEDFEVRLRRKDGTEIWAATNAHFIYDRDDNIVGLEGTTRDITRRKNAERELLFAKERAERASASKSEFLSGMSHELRTPLNAIIGFSQMMEFQDDADLTEKQRDYLSIIHGSGEHLLELINEILDLAQVEAGRMDVRLAPVGVQALVQDCVTLVRPLADKKSIRFTTDTHGGNTHHILVDRTKFKQILINLLSNAVKYNVEGGQVNLVIRPEDDTNLRIDVTDTGHGLSPEECSALFEPFQRLGAERSGIEGTGLGLVLAKRMVEAMGGDIRVTSAPGIGSTFSIIVSMATVDT